MRIIGGFLLTIAALLVPPVLYFPHADALHSERWRAHEEDVEIVARIEQARSAQRKLQQFHEASARLEVELEKVTRILPQSIDTDGIRARVQEAAAISGVELAGFEPYTPGIDHRFRYQWISVEAAGSAGALAAFMTDLRNAEMILDVSRLEMGKTRDGWRVRFFVETYALTT